MGKLRIYPEVQFLKERITFMAGLAFYPFKEEISLPTVAASSWCELEKNGPAKPITTRKTYIDIVIALGFIGMELRIIYFWD